MQKKYSKFSGWVLCLASVILLARVGNLDLLIILLPASLLLSYFASGTPKEHAEGGMRKR